MISLLSSRKFWLAILGIAANVAVLLLVQDVTTRTQAITAISALVGTLILGIAHEDHGAKSAPRALAGEVLSTVGEALQAPTLADAAKKAAADITTKIAAGAFMLALAAQMVGCSWFARHETQIDQAVKDQFACILTHAAAGDPPEAIAASCGGLAVHDVIDIVASAKRAGFVPRSPQ